MADEAEPAAEVETPVEAPPPEKARKKSSWLAKLPLIVGGVIALLVVAIVAIPFLIPASQYKAQIEKTATDAMGREFKINGPIRFTLLPVLGFKAEEVTVANAPGGAAPLFASIGELDIGVAFQPLLAGDVEVTKLVVRKPTLALEEDVGGKPNWVFETTAAETAPAAPSEPAQSSPVKNFGLADVTIEDGALTYRDRLGKVNALTALNAKGALPDLDAPTSIVSDFIYNADKVDLTLDFGRPRAFVDAGQTPLKVVIKAPKLDLAIDGALDAKTFAITGKLDAKGDSLRRLSAWTGNPIGDGGGLGAFSASGEFKMEGPRTDLANASFTLDKASGKGTIYILTDPNGAPPYVNGAVALGALDVNPYLAPPGAAPATAPAAPAPAATSAQPAATAPADSAPAAPAEGVNVNTAWDSAPIDMSGLKGANADLKLTTGRLLFQNIKVDSAAFDIALKDGVMNAKLNRLALYGGSASGSMMIDGRQAAMKFGTKLAVRGVNAETFLVDAMAFNQIEGRADMDIDIAAAGVSQVALMNTLAGSAKFSFANGAIRGFDLEKLTSQIKVALASNPVNKDAKTAFSALSGSFKIAGGVAHTDDGKMESTVVRAPWTGDIGMGKQDIKIRAVPVLLRSDLRGVTVPVDVTGPWAKVDIKPDLKGAASSAASAAVKTEVDKVIERNKGAINDFLSNLRGKSN